MVALITLGTYLDNFMPKFGGYTAINLWFPLAVLTMVLLKPYSALIAINAAFLLWIALGQAGLAYGAWSVMFDYYVPLMSVSLVLFAKDKWTTMMAIVIASIVRYLSHSIVGVYFWGATWSWSLAFNSVWSFSSLALTLAIVIIIYEKIIYINSITNQSENKLV